LGERLYRNDEVTHTTRYLTDALNDEAMDFITIHRDEPFFLFVSHAAPHVPLEAPPALVAEFGHIANQQRRIYAAMIKSLDDNVGRLIDHLIAEGLYENTVLIFTNDNGGVGGYPSNAPFAGVKGQIQYEGGLRVPFFM